MVCIKCGQELAEGTKFCTKCGYNVIPAPGSLLIRLIGIIFIILGIFGIISLITSIIAKINVIPLLSIVLAIINSISVIALGVSGILFCKNLDKIKLLQFFGFGYTGLWIVIFLINSIISFNQGLSFKYILIGSLVGIIEMVVLLSFFFIGVNKNLKAKEEQ